MDSVRSAACAQQHLDAIPEGSPGVSRLTRRKDNAWAVQKIDVLVQVDLLHGAGHPWCIANLRCPGSLQAVDQGAFPNIRQPNDACKIFANEH